MHRFLSKLSKVPNVELFPFLRSSIASYRYYNSLYRYIPAFAVILLAMKFTESLSKFLTFCQQTFRYSLRAQFDPLIQLSRPVFTLAIRQKKISRRDLFQFSFLRSKRFSKRSQCPLEPVSREPYLRYLHDKSTAPFFNPKT